MPKAFKKIYIEISNVCNLQCSFCPEVEREKDFMGQELFKNIIEQVSPLTESVCFHLMGEPLAHPNFSKYVEICENANLDVNLTSNGTLLNEAREESILNKAIKQVNFSVHSFEANFPGKDISTYLNKIFLFTEKAISQRPDLYINYRLWNLENSSNQSNQSTTNKIIFEKIKEFFGVIIKEEIDVRWKKGVRVKDRFYLHFDNRFEWPSPNQPKRTEVGFCHGLSSHIGILVDGTVVPCCLDKEGVLSLGNCRGRNIVEILNDTRARSIKDGFSRGILVEDMCQKCTFIQRFDKKLSGKSRVNPANVIMSV